MEDAPMSKKETLTNNTNLEKQVKELGEMIMAELRDIKKQDGIIVMYQEEQEKGALETHMTKEEERTIKYCMEKNRWAKDSSKLEDESMLKMTERLPNVLEFAQGTIFRAMLGQDESFDMNQGATAAWVPWKLRLEYIQRKE
eukprot:8529120-Heterocapsa_arctica.AAC.1